MKKTIRKVTSKKKVAKVTSKNKKLRECLFGIAKDQYSSAQQNFMNV